MPPQVVERWLERLTPGARRLDHEPLYWCTHIGVIIGATLNMLTGTAAQGCAFVSLAPAGQQALAWCMIEGSVICLYGTSIGTRLDPLRRVGRYAAERSGDRRYPYLVGLCGAPATVIGMGFYCATATSNASHWSDGSTGIAFAALSALGMALQVARFLIEVRRITRAVPVLIMHEMRRRRIGSEVRRLSSASG